MLNRASRREHGGGLGPEEYFSLGLGYYLEEADDDDGLPTDRGPSPWGTGWTEAHTVAWKTGSYAFLRHAMEKVERHLGREAVTEVVVDAAADFIAEGRHRPRGLPER